jgi:hypothetical protein
MDLHNGAIQTHRFDLDANELLLLQLLENSIEHARLRPAIHASVDRMPVTKALGHRSPLAAVLGYVEDRVDDGEILVRHIAALTRQKRLDASELFSGDFHAASISNSVNTP